jgi:two-component system cell cycle response regulator
MAAKILVIDSVMPNRIILKVKLSGAGYDVLIAASGREGIDAALHERPELIIIDMDLPDMPVEAVMQQLRSVASLHSVLVIMLASSNDAETRLRAYRAGCDEFYAKPYMETTLLARIRSFFRVDEQLRMLSVQSGSQFAHDLMGGGFFEDLPMFYQGSTITIIGQPEEAMRLKRKLPEQSATTLCHHSPEVVTNGTALPFDTVDAVIIMSDTADPNAALHLISTLRGRPQTRDARFCVHFELGSRATDRDLAFDFGADAIFMADDHAEEMGLRLAGLIKRKQRADGMRERIKHGLKLAMHDPLTNIPNRRYMHAVMRSFITKARQTAGSVAVIICDIDRFKSINDQFGHAAGDAVLQEVAQRLNGALRAGDLIARIGGEEFMIALPNANMGDARAVAERLVSSVCARSIQIENLPPMMLTISAGLAMSIPDLTSPLDTVIDAVMNEADQAMLQSKARGRNKITLGRSAA